MNTKGYGYLFAFITVLIWSSTFIISKVVLGYVTPIQLLTIRMLIAILFLFAIYPKVHKDMHLKSELLFLISGIALALYFIFENTALVLTYSSNVGLLVALSPIFTAILVSIAEKTSYFIPRYIIGLILAFIGVFLVEFGKAGIEGFAFLGDMLAILAGLMFSVYTLFFSRITKEYHLIQKTRKVFIYVFFTLIVYSLVSGESLLWDTISWGTVSGALYLGLAASSIAFLLWNRAIGLIGTFRTNLFIYLITVMTVIFSIILLDDPITIVKSIGTVIIITGLYISEREPKNKSA